MGDFVGALMGKNEDGQSAPPAPIAPPPTVSPDNPDTAKAMDQAEQDQDGQRKRGQAANMLSYGANNASPQVSRSVLLGS